MAKPQTFERISRRCIGVLAVMAASVAIAALLIVLRTAGFTQVAWIDDVPKGALIGWGLMVFVVTFANVATWTFRSHGLAVEHGMIPRATAGWSALAWVLPLANFVLPFRHLQQRFFSYRVQAKKALRWLQALFVGTCLLWAWIASGLVRESTDRWLPLAVAGAALFLWRLRGVVKALSAIQSRAEGK